MEVAIDPAGIVEHVTLIGIRQPGLRADEVLQRKLRSLANATVHVNAQTTEDAWRRQRCSRLTTDRISGEFEPWQVELAGVFVQSCC